MKTIFLSLILIFVYAGPGWGDDSLMKLDGVANNGYIEIVNVEEKSDGSGGDVFLNISYQVLRGFQDKNAGFYKIMVTYYNAIDRPFDGKSKWINKALSGGERGQIRFSPPMYTRSYRVWLPLKNMAQINNDDS